MLFALLLGGFLFILEYRLLDLNLRVLKLEQAAKQEGDSNENR
jgi:hypothetical protein